MVFVHEIAGTGHKSWAFIVIESAIGSSILDFLKLLAITHGIGLEKIG